MFPMSRVRPLQIKPKAKLSAVPHIEGEGSPEATLQHVLNHAELFQDVVVGWLKPNGAIGVTKSAITLGDYALIVRCLDDELVQILRGEDRL